MEKAKVEIIKLPPLKVASFLGFSTTPEDDAHKAANAWLKEQNLFKPNVYRSFGFNNPNPSAGSPKYGYEIWIDPKGEFPQNTEAKTLQFEGGLYAMTHCSDLEVIGETWQNLVAWIDSSEYQLRDDQWLEELLNPWVEDQTDFEFKLYLAIRK